MLLEVILMFAFTVWVFAQNVTVATQDSRMLFDGTWVAQDSGGYEYTTTIGSSVIVSVTTRKGTSYRRFWRDISERTGRSINVTLNTAMPQG